MKHYLKKVISIIVEHKSKVLLVFLLQAFFFISLSVIAYNTTIPAISNARLAVEYYDSINASESSGVFGYMGEDPLFLHERYEKVIYYFKLMWVFFVMAFVIINGLLWALTYDLVKKMRAKRLFQYFSKFGIITLIFVLLNYLVFSNVMGSSVVQMSGGNFGSFFGAVLFALVLLYFFVLSLSLIGMRKTKDIINLTYIIGVKMFYYVLLVYLVNMVIIGVFSYLLFKVLEMNIFVLALFIILFIASFVFTRILLMVVVEELSKKRLLFKGLF